MSYYHICPCCGAALDPGERCDCKDEKAAPDAANIQSGENGKGLSAHISASSVQKNEEDYK